MNKITSVLCGVCFAVMAMTVVVTAKPAYAQCIVKDNGDYICDDGEAPPLINPRDPTDRPRGEETPKYKAGQEGPYEGLPVYTSAVTVQYFPLPGESQPSGPLRPPKTTPCAHCDDPNRPMDAGTLAGARELVKAREGFVKQGGCHKAYRDSEGHLTIGYGHLVQYANGTVVDGNYNSGSCISDAQADALLDQDLTKSGGYYTEAVKQANEMTGGKATHCLVVALTSANYQRGTGWQNATQNLRETNALIQQGDFCAAADKLESGNDKWHQIERAKHIDRVAELACALRKTGGCGGTGSGGSGSPGGSNPGGSGTPVEGGKTCNPNEGISAQQCDSMKAHAGHDTAGGGYCAMGVANILTNTGCGHVHNPPLATYPVTRGDAYNWQYTLPSNGWQNIGKCDPATAPNGSILVFDRNNPPGSGGGARYGHVEIACTGTDGRRVYISDAVRNNPGGTVPGNYIGTYTYQP